MGMLVRSCVGLLIKLSNCTVDRFSNGKIFVNDFSKLICQ